MRVEGRAADFIGGADVGHRNRGVAKQGLCLADLLRSHRRPAAAFPAASASRIKPRGYALDELAPLVLGEHGRDLEEHIAGGGSVANFHFGYDGRWLGRRLPGSLVQRSISRTAFGKPISEHQLIQAKLAQMAVGIDASGLLVYRAAWDHDEGRRLTPRSAAVAKLFSTETSFQIVDQALQIFGGMGVVKGTTVERKFRHVRAFRIFDGTSEIQQLIIARDILKSRVQ